MEIRNTPLEGVVVITPKKFEDGRGFFAETYNEKLLAQHGISIRFVQDNHSASNQSGTVRGLHYQLPPHEQAKLVRVTRGAIFDVAVDIRPDSPTFKQHFAIELSATNFRQLLIPAGLAHGFCTLVPNTEVHYKASDFYAPECEAGLQWDDPVLGIAWPVNKGEAVLSERDHAWCGIDDLIRQGR